MHKLKNKRGFLPVNQVEYRLTEAVINRLRPRSVLLLGCPNRKLEVLLRTFEIDVSAHPFETAPEPGEITALLETFTAQGRHFDLALFFTPDDFDPERYAMSYGSMVDVADEVLISPRLDAPAVQTVPLAPAEGEDFESLDAPVLMHFPAGTVLLRRKGARRFTFILNTSGIHGGTIVILKYAQELALRGHIVTLACWEDKRPAWAELPERVRFVRVSQENWVDFGDDLPDGDALIATLWTTAPFVSAAPVCKGQKYYLVQHYESLWAGDPQIVDNTYTSIPLKKLVVSTWLKDILKNRFAEDSTLILNGTDFAGTLNQGVPARDTAALRIGMLFHEAKWKGIDDGLYAFNALKQKYPQAELVLYGTKKPEKLPEGCTEFYEKPTREKLKQVLQTLDIFVSPSIAEGFGLPALEAMCCGVPIVLTDSGGCRDYANAQTSLLSPPSNPEALAVNLIRLAGNHELRTRMSAADVQTANQFTWSRSADWMEQTLTTNPAAKPLHIFYVTAGYRWADAYHDPMYIRALQQLGHRVTVFHPLPTDWEWAKAFVNVELLDAQYQEDHKRRKGSNLRELVDQVKAAQPDLVFFNHALMVPPVLLNELRCLGVPSAVWDLDEPQEMHMSSDKGKLFDYVFLQDRGSLKFHLDNGNPNTFYLPHGMDAAMHHPAQTGEEADEYYKSDLLILGTGFPKRRKIVEMLMHQPVNITVIGRNWEGLEAPNVRILPMVSYAEAARFYRHARFTLNVHRESTDMVSGKWIPEPESPNASLFFGMASGSLQLVDEEYPGASDFYTAGLHYLTFNDEESLKEIVTDCLAHPEKVEKITREAMRVSLRYHTYARRFEEALAMIGTPKSQPRKYSVSRQNNARIVPIYSTTILSTGSLAQLKNCLAMELLSSSEKKYLQIIHPFDAEKNDWLDRKQIPHVTMPQGSRLADMLNAALQTAEGDYLAVLLDQGIATLGFTSHMVSCLIKNPEIGVIGPAMNRAAGAQKVDLVFHTIEEMNQAAVQLYIDNPGHFEPAETIETVCFAVNLKAVQAAGNFDPAFPAGTLEMKDFCLRLRKNGWKTGWTKAAYVYLAGTPPQAGFSELVLAQAAEQDLRAKYDPIQARAPERTRELENFLAGIRNTEIERTLTRLLRADPPAGLAAQLGNDGPGVLKALERVILLAEGACPPGFLGTLKNLRAGLQGESLPAAPARHYDPDETFQFILNAPDMEAALEQFKDRLDVHFLTYLRSVVANLVPTESDDVRDGLEYLIEYTENCIRQR